jgi:hypothetical protein
LNFALCVCLVWLGSLAIAGEPDLTREAVIAQMKPAQGAKADRGDLPTLAGKVVCGYQGWFAAEGDGSGRGWRHYASRRRFQPGSCTIDLWPDVSELDDDEKFATPFRHADGKVAQVFSSNNRKTVLRHFEWMRDYGVDGVFVQRFAVETIDPRDFRQCNTVLDHAREGANLYGRCYAVMYDLSGLREGGTQSVIDDWKLLIDRMRLGRDENDPAYLHHGGKPLVAVWGIGFDDGRKYTLAECERLIDFLRTDEKYGGFAVMIGVPTGWRTLDADSVGDRALQKIMAKADIISPWTVGRYKSLEDVESHAASRWKPDLAWCRENGKEYLPVVFPGFSWHNLHPRAPLDQIPRQKGKFLWKQFVEARKAGAMMVYVAMFDEMDEGTAIFKCTNDVPAGASSFVTFEGLPSDHYLWLTGQGRELLRGNISRVDAPPVRTIGDK